MVFSKVALVTHASMAAILVYHGISSALMPDSLIKFLNCLFHDKKNSPECMDKSNFSLTKTSLKTSQLAASYFQQLLFYNLLMELSKI